MPDAHFCSPPESGGPPDDPGTIAAVVDRLQQAAQLWRARLAAQLAHLGLNESRCAVLQHVAAAGCPGCSQPELAERLGLSESNVSALVDRMCTDGLLLRQRSAHDRRRCTLQLSPAGEAIWQQARLRKTACAESLLKSVSAGRRAALVELLDELLEERTGPRSAVRGQCTIADAVRPQPRASPASDLRRVPLQEEHLLEGSDHARAAG